MHRRNTRSVVYDVRGHDAQIDYDSIDDLMVLAVCSASRPGGHGQHPH
jgi:hypothetical protein